MNVETPVMHRVSRYLDRSEGVIALGCILLVCVATALAFGKDINWDQFNYHFYSAHALLHVPLDTDFLGGSVQRYLNPFGYLPFYWMVTANWNSALICAILASIHGLNIFCIWHLSRRYIFISFPYARTWSALSAAFAFLSPVFLGTLGGTFIDPTTSVFVLIALIAASRSLRAEDGLRWILLAGALTGAATGFKLTNLIFGAALGLALALCSGKFRHGVPRLLVFASGAFLGLVAIDGWWAWQLNAEFGNPVFPLMNQYFQSPEFPTWVLQHRRFLPDSVSELALVPIKLIEHRSWMYVENAAPDLKLAASIVMLGFAICTSLYRRKLSFMEGDRCNRPAALLLSFTAIATALWAVSSGNGRYAIPILLLLGPVLVWFVVTVVSIRNVALGSLLVLLSVQFFVVREAGNPRWLHEDWSKHWFELDIPRGLVDRPAGYISIGPNSNSFIAPFLHPDARFAHLFSAYSVDPDGAGSTRIRRFIAQHKNQLRGLVRVDNALAGAIVKQGDVFQLDTQLSSWNLRVDITDCEYIRLSPAKPVATFLTCRLLEGSPLKADIDRERKSIDLAFNRVEGACPTLFSPAGAYTVKQGPAWLRRYINTDITLFSRNGEVTYSRYEYGPFDVKLGKTDMWTRETQKIVCPRLSELERQSAP